MGEKEDKEVTITYETLFELLRREKSREGLQELQDSFFDDVAQYLKDKVTILNSQKGNIFSEEEREKTEVQLKNIKKILTEFYERREKKILNLALNKVRTKGGLINTTALLGQEKQLFDDLSAIMEGYRSRVLAGMIAITNVKNAEKSQKSSSEAVQEAGKAKTNAEDNASDTPKQSASIPENTSIPENEPGKAKELKREANNPQNTLVIRFLQAIPKFVGPNLEIYGPFDQEDIANLPEKVASVLVEKGRAEILKKA